MELIVTKYWPMVHLFVVHLPKELRACWVERAESSIGMRGMSLDCQGFEYTFR